ncbi:MAG: hypothetical protein KBF75_14465 [Saprospiraceae bacterium]|nr:hypothetical protein [Saprospiraceae bacterium]
MNITNLENSAFRNDFTFKDYYPGGMVMPERNFSTAHYRFGFNTQEKVDEISGAGNHNTALFWEYDTRLVRRWNIDPRQNQSLSGYVCLNDNPIWNSDFSGDSPIVQIQQFPHIQSSFSDAYLSQNNPDKYPLLMKNTSIDEAIEIDQDLLGAFSSVASIVYGGPIGIGIGITGLGLSFSKLAANFMPDANQSTIEKTPDDLFGALGFAIDNTRAQLNQTTVNKTFEASFSLVGSLATSGKSLVSSPLLPRTFNQLADKSASLLDLTNTTIRSYSQLANQFQINSVANYTTVITNTTINNPVNFEASHIPSTKVTVEQVQAIKNWLH